MRRFRLQFGLWWLFLLPVYVGLLSALYVKHRDQRSYPLVLFNRSSINGRPYHSMVVYFEDGSEGYCDLQPLGTLNEVGISVKGKLVLHEFVYEDTLGTPQEYEAGPMPPECIARYRTLKAFLAARFRLHKMSDGQKIQVLLPADYPTFEEFVAEWKRKNRAPSMNSAAKRETTECARGQAGNRD